jgi:hypothetical protein
MANEPKEKLRPGRGALEDELRPRGAEPVTEEEYDDPRVRAGEGALVDELRPRGEGAPVPQRDKGGDERDTAGQHGPMKPEAAKGLPEPEER